MMVITRMEPGTRYLAEDSHASCKVKVCVAIPNQMRTKCMELVSLSVAPSLRGTGLATKLLTQVTEEADEHNMLLVLFPEPFGEGLQPTQEQLIDFYEKFGWQLIQTRPKAMMARMPHSTPGPFTPNYIGKL